jgi:hypothetical protein
LAAGLWILGCSADPGPEPGVEAPPPPLPRPETGFAEEALGRARSWVDAKMPYCGGPNGGTDVICGGTCRRDGPAKNAAWDRYRSDCSGFVSWSWGLPPPGRSTSALAPFDTEVSTVIAVADLAPGDALNTDGHVMLWGGWVDEVAGTARILEESRCGRTAQDTTLTFHHREATTLTSADGRTFHAIRYRGP